MVKSEQITAHEEEVNPQHHAILVSQNSEPRTRNLVLDIFSVSGDLIFQLDFWGFERRFQGFGFFWNKLGYFQFWIRPNSFWSLIVFSYRRRDLWFFFIVIVNFGHLYKQCIDRCSWWSLRFLGIDHHFRLFKRIRFMGTRS